MGILKMGGSREMSLSSSMISSYAKKGHIIPDWCAGSLGNSDPSQARFGS